MATETNTEQYRDNQMWRPWVNGIGIIVALIGLFWQPIWLGIIGAIMGIIGMAGAKAMPTDKAWGWISLIVGVVVLILGIYGWTFAG